MGSKSIGIFDSGIGGLTVLKEIIKVLPTEDTVYLGDTARVPYGNKSFQTILRYALEDARFLMARGVKLLVIACNTAAAISTKFLRENLDIPIVEVIGPGAKKAAETTKTGKVGVIGTEATIKSGSYTAYIKKSNPDIEVFGKACPLFVPLAEEVCEEDEDASYFCKIKSLTVSCYLRSLKKEGIDTLVLGCTHYPLLKRDIEAYMGEKVVLIDSAEETAKEVLKVLQEHNLVDHTSKKGKHQYFVTDASSRFMTLATRFLGTVIDDVAEVELS